MAQVILDLSTEKKPADYIKIDGKQYALRRADELSLPELVAFDHLEREIAKVGKAGADTSVEDAEGLEKSLNDYVNKALEQVDEEAVAGLHWSQKLEIVRVFMSQGSTPAPAGNGKTAAEEPATPAVEEAPAAAA